MYSEPTLSLCGRYAPALVSFFYFVSVWIFFFLMSFSNVPTELPRVSLKPAKSTSNNKVRDSFYLFWRGLSVGTPV